MDNIYKENIRINMAFTDDNYNIIAQKSEMLGIPMATFINETIANIDIKAVENYISNLFIIPNKHMIPRKKGHKMKRINIKLTQKVYNILTSGADKYNQTLTQYLNCILNYKIKKQDRLKNDMNYNFNSNKIIYKGKEYITYKELWKNYKDQIPISYENFKYKIRLHLDDVEGFMDLLLEED